MVPRGPARCTPQSHGRRLLRRHVYPQGCHSHCQREARRYSLVLGYHLSLRAEVSHWTRRTSISLVNSNLSDSFPNLRVMVRYSRLMPSLVGVAGKSAFAFRSLSSAKWTHTVGRMCPGRFLADRTVWLAAARMLAVFDISRTKDAEGRLIDPEIKFATGIARYVYLMARVKTVPTDFAAILQPPRALFMRHPTQRCARCGLSP